MQAGFLFAGFYKGSQDKYLTFKSLNTSNSGALSLDEFMNIYQHVKFRWKMESLPSQDNDRAFVTRMKHYVVVTLNFVWVIIDVSLKSSLPKDNPWMDLEFKFFGISVLFVLIYTVEMVMKWIVLGIREYCASGWNIFDCVVTLVSIIGIIMEAVLFSGLGNDKLYIVVILRPLRIIRLFKMKKSFRDIFGALFILLPRMTSLAIAMLLLYYTFAIIGMELFAQYTDQLKDCCKYGFIKNTSVQVFYAFNDSIDGYYYLNSFENIFISGVTLFELTVVNNWWIIMEGFANVVSPWSRLYFMTFYIIIMIVMAVVVAFILEAFIFRIQYRHQMEKETLEVHASQKVTIEISTDDLFNNCNINLLSNGSQLVRFHGKRKMCKSDFSVRMYANEVKEWLNVSQSATALTEQPPTSDSSQVRPTFVSTNRDDDIHQFNNNVTNCNNNHNNNSKNDDNNSCMR
ncbi:hypothetical protein HELRODRAFT_167688 [Helobdella robusta]|uniref:Ion transport domain-containing protein n=1 Tax=Helobdella robusta TaxID=6412 RepID=T1EZP0_HELRO|nr:hypothetical protein HELRODRAFT_167688 [Helobdella robusta]ESO09870.1 hypothetical protein HELRODRAFT_167688 [Helobdella robusta]